MKKTKILAGLLSVSLMACSVPAVYALNFDAPTVSTAKTADSGIIFESGFEGGAGLDKFSGRAGVEVIEEGGDAHSGDSCMKISGRESGWNGPQILLDDICEAGTEYLVSAWVKADWYNNVNLSMEFTDSEGERHYSNLKSAVSQGDWAEISETKFSFSEDVTNVYLYFECADKANIYVDDFVLKKAPVLEIEQDIASLKDVYSPYFKFGTAVTASELASSTRKELIKKHFNSITLGNELKPESIIDRKASQAEGNDNPQVNLASARSILNFARDNKIPVRGHVLVWHSQTPDWFFKENYEDNGEWCDKETMLIRMENYIKNVFAALEKEYPDVDFYAWDVVNECFLDNGSPRNPGEQGSNGSNNSAWVKVFGDNSFIEYAFKYARQYAPATTKLYYNDFNEYMPDKTKAIVAMATDLREKGLIDGIGMQSHLDVGFPTVSAYEKALKAFTETGLDVQVTELDITTSDLSESGMEKQAEIYSGIMDACVKYSDSISAVVLWGTTDDASWRASKSPLIFDKEYVAKPSYYSIIDGLEDVVVTQPSTTTATTATSTTTNNLKKCDNCGTYSNPAKIYSVEADGTTKMICEACYVELFGEKPTTPTEPEPPTSGTMTTTATETTKTTTATEPPTGDIAIEVLFGDANVDGEVNISDAVTIMSYSSNPDTYGLSDFALECADVYTRGDGVNNMDALSVQKYVAQILEELPESYED